MIRDHLISSAVGSGRPPSTNGLSRRRFLEAGAAAGGGLMLSFSLPFAKGRHRPDNTVGGAKGFIFGIEDGQSALG
jgi:isoquinoline 1-oxidoreductase subunit beta